MDDPRPNAPASPDAPNPLLQVRRLFLPAWRQVWDHPRRSLFTISAVALVVILIALTRSMQTGTYDAFESSAIRLFSGEIQLQHPDYHANPRFDHTFSARSLDLDALLAEHPQVIHATRRLAGQGLVSSSKAGAGASIVGIEPLEEAEVTGFLQALHQGRRLTPSDSTSALLGLTLARQLDVSLGDTVAVLTTGYQSTLGAGRYVVQGLLRTGNDVLDQGLMVLPLAEAQRLFRLPGRLSQVVVRTDDFRDAQGTARSLEASLPEGSLSALHWDVLMPEIQQMLALDTAGTALFFVFLIILLAFELFNAATVGVVARAETYRRLEVFGVRPTHLSLLVVLEGLIKAVLGLAVGLLVAGALISTLDAAPVGLPERLSDLYTSLGFHVDEFTFGAGYRVFLDATMAVGFAALLALIHPAIRAYQLTPLTALRAV